MINEVSFETNLKAIEVESSKQESHQLSLGAISFGAA